MRVNHGTRVSHERICMELAEVNALLVLLVRLLLGDNASPLLSHIAKVNNIRYPSSLPQMGVIEPPVTPPSSPEDAEVISTEGINSSLSWLSAPAPPLVLDGANKEQQEESCSTS
jgi:hypothetical protein